MQTHSCFIASTSFTLITSIIKGDFFKTLINVHTEGIRKAGNLNSAGATQPPATRQVIFYTEKTEDPTLINKHMHIT